MSSLAHLILPHPHTHQKARLLSFKALFVYIFLFLALQYGITLINFIKPGVLGISTNITVEQVIDETNKQRIKAGLNPVKENEMLDKAAQAKAANMFAENYWAHFSPSGKDPWGFMNQAGYKFSYAGENLAKNFQTSEDVVIAWMNSPSHRENLLNPNYQDIGIAVVNGTLQGQQTTLVVQMFGKPAQVVAAAPSENEPPSNPGANPSSETVDLTPDSLAQSPTLGQVANAQTAPSVKSQFSFDPYAVTRVVGISIFGLIFFLLIVDFVEMKRRGVLQVTSHHFAHLGILAISTSAVLSTKVGQITDLAAQFIR